MKTGQALQERSVALWVEKQPHPMGNLLELRGSVFFVTKKQPDRDRDESENDRDDGEGQGRRSFGCVGSDAREPVCTTGFTVVGFEGGTRRAGHVVERS